MATLAREMFGSRGDDNFQSKNKVLIKIFCFRLTNIQSIGREKK